MAITQILLPSRLSARARTFKEAADRRRHVQIDLVVTGAGVHPVRVQHEGHRLVERRAHDAAVREAGRPLVVLLHEEAAHEPALRVELQVQPEDVRQAAAEAELVVGDRRRGYEAATSWRST